MQGRGDVRFHQCRRHPALLYDACGKSRCVHYLGGVLRLNGVRRRLLDRQGRIQIQGIDHQCDGHRRNRACKCRCKSHRLRSCDQRRKRCAQIYGQPRSGRLEPELLLRIRRLYSSLEYRNLSDESSGLRHIDHTGFERTHRCNERHIDFRRRTVRTGQRQY